MNTMIRYLILISIVYNPVLTVETTLKFVNVVFRHGDRTPSPSYELYPNDPYKNYNFSPPGYGKLTKSGELRVYNLGQFLREIYNDFLGNSYVPGSVEARTTDVNRTKESLKLVLKALYPGVLIPITFKPVLEDLLLFPQLCPGYIIEYLKAIGEPDVKEEMTKLEDFKKNLTLWTGKKINSALDMYIIYTTLEAEKFMNLKLPSWTQGVYPDGDLFNAYVLASKVMNYNEAMRRQNGGLLIREFTEAMKSVKNGSMDKNRKIMLYSAHDITILAVLKALGVYYPNVVQFASAVIIEFHLIDQIYYVKVSYYLGVPPEIKELKIPGCEKLCPFDQFINLMQNVIPSDFDLLCDKIRKVIQFGINSKIISNVIEKFNKIFS